LNQVKFTCYGKTVHSYKTIPSAPYTVFGMLIFIFQILIQTMTCTSIVMKVHLPGYRIQ